MRRPPLNLYAAALCLLGYGWLLLNGLYEGEGVRFGGCPSRWLFHIPCPGCGATRACLKLLEGEFGEAFRLNPNAYIIMAALVAVPVLLALDYGGRHGLFRAVYDGLNRWLRNWWVLLSVAAVEGWIVYRNFCLYF